MCRDVATDYDAWRGEGGGSRGPAPGDRATADLDAARAFLETGNAHERHVFNRILGGRAGDAARRAVTRTLEPLARRQIQRALRTPHVRLNLGCGFAPKRGWTNIDLIGPRGVLPWNLARGIPFPDASVDTVFHEHVLEHMPLHAGFALTRECRRVLRPTGVLRFGVPDAEGVIRSYAGQINDRWARSRPTPMLAVCSLFYEHGHVAMCDSLTLELLCRAAGFAEVARAYDGESRIEPCPDDESRFGSAWVEAVA